jgi:hypothetical protein
MALASYTDLKTSIETWLARADLSALSADFITLCEADLNATLITQAQLSAETLGSTDAAGAVALPADFIAMHYVLSADDGLMIDQFSEMPMNEGLTLGQLGGYRIAGNAIETVPAIANRSNVLKYRYYKTIPALSGTNTTNWLLIKFPNVYLYGSLMQAEAFIKDDPRVPVWKAAYDEAVMKVKQTSHRNRWQDTSLAMRVVR